MPHVIAILNGKGGTGKTTLATNLAGCLHKQGWHILIIDSDPQGTARDWRNAQPNNADLPSVIGIDRPTIHKDLPRLAASYDFVVIDGAARLEDMLVSAIKVADSVLIPVQPSGYDLWAVAGLVDLIHARRQITGNKPFAAFVVSRYIVGTHLAREINDAIDRFGLPVFLGRTAQRVVYAEAGQSGLTVLDLEPNGKASGEIEAIVRELLEVTHHDSDAKAIA